MKSLALARYSGVQYFTIGQDILQSAPRQWKFLMAQLDPYTSGSPGAVPREGQDNGESGGLSASRERLVKQLIQANLGGSLEVTALADACSLSRSHFSRAFKCSTGVSPQEWIHRQRIARAKELIRHSELSLIQIGLECGYCDQAHFCRSFTRSVGVPPLAWRSVVRDAPRPADSVTGTAP